MTGHAFLFLKVNLFKKATQAAKSINWSSRSADQSCKSKQATTSEKIDGKMQAVHNQTVIGPEDVYCRTDS